MVEKRWTFVRAGMVVRHKGEDVEVVSIESDTEFGAWRIVLLGNGRTIEVRGGWIATVVSA